MSKITDNEEQILPVEWKKKKVNKIDSLTYEWSVLISKDNFENAIKNELKALKKRVKMDGYRPGKVPDEAIEAKYGKDVVYPALNKVMQNVISEIREKEKYNLAIAPEISIGTEIKRGNEVNFAVKFVLKPTVNEIKYEKIEMDVCELELTDADKNEEIERFRQKMAKHELVTEPVEAKSGDVVDIDFVGRTAADNVEFGGGSAKGYKLELGSKSFVDTFEDQIVGHKKGDKFDVKVKFPEVYHSTELAGKDAIFAITLNDIYIKQLPELNDEYAKSIGFTKMEEIKDLLFKNLKDIYDAQMKSLIKDQLFEIVVAKSEFDLPESIINRETEDLFNEEKEAFEKDEKNKGKKFDEKERRKEISARLHKSYAGFYLIDAIANQNNFNPTEEEVQQVVTQDAIRAGMDIQQALDRVKGDEKIKNYIIFTIREAKVFDYIYERIKKNVKKLDRKAFEKFLETERNKKNK